MDSCVTLLYNGQELADSISVTTNQIVLRIICVKKMINRNMYIICN